MNQIKEQKELNWFQQYHLSCINALPSNCTMEKEMRFLIIMYDKDSNPVTKEICKTSLTDESYNEYLKSKQD